MTSQPAQPPDGATICVLGMHRSGTSLIARLLDLAGVRLGPPERLLGPTERNPRGYWEHDGLTSISEEVLRRLGGTWREPADPPRGWARSLDLDELEDLAREIIAEDFVARSDGPWGWKDPRLSLTLAFWRRLVPVVRPVLCVRDPLEVAASTVQSVAFEGFPPPTTREALQLWVRYTASALRSVGDEPVLVSSYERALGDPLRELGRLAAFAGVVPEGGARSALTHEVDPNLRRARADDGGARRRLPSAARALYEALLARAARPAADPVDRPLLRLASDAEAALRSAPRRASAKAPASRPLGGPRPRLSVALATFDGMPYLEEMLESLATQVRPPDEVVVCDDGSSDRSVRALEAFARRVDFPVHVVRNERRIGSTKNFEQAVRLCRGDVILLADQDDVWEPEKAATVAAAFAAEATLTAHFTDARVIDDRGEPSGGTLWEAFGITPERVRAYREGSAPARVEQLLHGNLMTGACMAFRASHRALVVPFPHTWVQDAWIGLLLSAVGPVEMSPDTLVQYRLHSGQQIGLGVGGLTPQDRARRQRQVVRRATKEERPAFFREADNVLMAAIRLRRAATAGDGPAPAPGVLDVLEGKADHFRVRGRMARTQRRGRAVARELAAGRYGRYSNGWTSAAKDLLLLERLRRV